MYHLYGTCMPLYGAYMWMYHQYVYVYVCICMYCMYPRYCMYVHVYVCMISVCMACIVYIVCICMYTHVCIYMICVECVRGSGSSTQRCRHGVAACATSRCEMWRRRKLVSASRHPIFWTVVWYTIPCASVWRIALILARPDPNAVNWMSFEIMFQNSESWSLQAIPFCVLCKITTTNNKIHAHKYGYNIHTWQQVHVLHVLHVLHACECRCGCIPSYYSDEFT